MLTAIVFGYIGLVMLMVIYFGRKVKTSDSFFLAGRKLGWLVVTLSIGATSLGGGTLIGYTGAFYSIGIDWYFMVIGSVASALIVGYFAAEKIRSLNQYTIPDILALRYDNRSRIVGAVMIILGDITIICAQIMAFSGILSGLLGMPVGAARAVAVLVFIVTAMAGGLVGVVYTDAIQVIFIGGGIAAVLVTVVAKSGGIVSIFSQLPSQYFVPFQVLPVHEVMGNVIALLGLGLASQAIYFQRINASKSPREAKKAVLAGVPIVIIFTGIIFPLIGYSARVLLGPGISDDQMVGVLVGQVLPPVVGALFVASVIGAILTTCNSFVLSTSMNFLRDILEGGFKKKLSDRTKLIIGRLTVIGVSLLAYLMVFTMENLVSALVFAYTMTAVMVVPIYGGLYWRRPGALGGLLSIVLGGISIIIWQLLNQPWGINTIFVGLVCSFIGLLLGCFTAPISQDKWEIIKGSKQTAQL